MTMFYHNYQKGNIVRLKATGEEMQIVSVLRNPFDGTLSGYIVCAWTEKGQKYSRSFHVNDVEFVNIGDAKPYDVDSNPHSSWF